MIKKNLIIKFNLIYYNQYLNEKKSISLLRLSNQRKKKLNSILKRLLYDKKKSFIILMIKKFSIGFE